jgi:hypothetical protein
MLKSEWLTWCRARKACVPGLEEGERLFEAGKTYDVMELMRSELGQKHKLWLLTLVAKNDVKARKLLQRWITACCDEMGVTGIDLRTEESSREALNTALRLKSQENGLQAAREWANGKLQALAGDKKK